MTDSNEVPIAAKLSHRGSPSPCFSVVATLAVTYDKKSRSGTVAPDVLVGTGSAPGIYVIGIWSSRIQVPRGAAFQRHAVQGAQDGAIPTLALHPQPKRITPVVMLIDSPKDARASVGHP